MCWEDAGPECTKCTQLGKTACKDGQLLAANACQKGETETHVRKTRLQKVCERVITDPKFEERKEKANNEDGYEGVWRKIRERCGKFPAQCKWVRTDDDIEAYGKCVPRDDYNPKPGDRVIVGSGVEWKEDWQDIQKQENRKGRGGMDKDEHVQNVNKIWHLTYLRAGTIVEEEPFCDDKPNAYNCKPRYVAPVGDAEKARRGMEQMMGLRPPFEWLKNEPTYTIKYDDGKYYNKYSPENYKIDEGFRKMMIGPNTLNYCMNQHTKEFEVSDCCSCDMGLWNDVTCADALESNGPNWGDTWTDNIQSWHYDGVMCKMDCPPNTKWDWPSFYCNATCDWIIDSTKTFCTDAGKKMKNRMKCSSDGKYYQLPDPTETANLCEENCTGTCENAPITPDERTCSAHRWEGMDGSRHTVCRLAKNGGCESVFQGEWKEGIIPGACYKQGSEVTFTRRMGPHLGWPWDWVSNCEDAEETDCQWTIIGAYSTCMEEAENKGHTGQWVSGFAPALCYRVEPREFSAASMGSAVAIAQWYPTRGKRAFIPKTHVKANYGPRTWMRSTYPKMRFKPSFFPVQRPRRTYWPRVRLKPIGTGDLGRVMSGGEDPYAVGKARNAWWWDKYFDQDVSAKACFQGCEDPLGEADITESRCSLSKQVCEKCCKGNGKRQRYIGELDRIDDLKQAVPDDLCGYCEGMPPVNIFGQKVTKEECQRHGKVWKESIKGVWDEDNMRCTFPGAKDDDVVYGPRGCTAIPKEPEKSLYETAKKKGGYNYPPLCRAYWTPGQPSLGGLQIPFICDTTENTYTSEEACNNACSGKCSFVAEESAKKGDNVSPRKRVAVKRWVDDCGEFFVGKEKKNAKGQEIGGWCMEYVEEARKLAYDGICLNFGVPEGKEPIFCQKSAANCVDVCKGVWNTNMKEIASTTLPKEAIYPDISSLGSVTGYTRNDKNTLLMPFSLPQGVEVGVDEKGEPVMREILLTLDDNGSNKVFRVADRSLDFDRREATSCDDLGVTPVSTFENKSEEECKQACVEEEACRAFNWNVQNKCTLYDKNYKRDEDDSQSNICSIMKDNPYLAKNAMGVPIGFSVRLEPVDNEGLENELHLLDVQDDIEGTGIPMPYEKHPGEPKKLGIMGTKNNYRMRRYQSSSLHGGDICRNWIMDRHGNANEILGKDERSPLYSKVCNEYKEDCPSGDCSILNHAMDWCNTRVDSARASSGKEQQRRLEQESTFHTWTDGKCSDPSIKSKGACEGTMRSEEDRIKEGQDNARKFAAWQSQEMLEDIPRCLPDTFSAFDLPARACPRWAADGAQGKFCRDLAEMYPLQYDQKIYEFCDNKDNALLPACDCLSADVVGSERRSKDNKSLAYCTAALDARKADNYNDRADFCKTKQMLASGGKTGLEGTLNNFKHVFYEKCQDALDAPHVLKPKIRISATNKKMCKIDSEDGGYVNFCGVKLSGCEKQTMPDICANVVNQTINNCIIGAGDGPCGVIDNVTQTNNCCKEGGEHNKKCEEINVARSTVNNKILLNPEAEARRRTDPILENSDGIYKCEKDNNLFTSIADCISNCETDCVKAYAKNAGSTFATGVISDMAFTYDPAVEDPALTAAKKCAEMNNENDGSCTGFLFNKPDSAGDWLQYTILAADPELTPKYGATAFTVA